MRKKSTLEEEKDDDLLHHSGDKGFPKKEMTY